MINYMANPINVYSNRVIINVFIEVVVPQTIKT